MANQEHGLEYDQGPGDTRTLSPAATQRVLLRLASFQPLTLEGAHSFRRAVLGDNKPGVECTMIVREGSYILDFNSLAEEDTTATLTRAVEVTDKTIVENVLPIDIVEAWTIPTDGPQVSTIKPELWDSVTTDVTEAAQEIFALHHDQLMAADFRHLFDEDAQ